MTLLFGLAALLVILWMLSGLVRANPKGLAIGMRMGGGVAALAGAVFLGLRGQLSFALPLGAAGLGLLGWLPWSVAGFGARTQKTGGQRSQVRSAVIEMELDHDTGVMTGRVIAGRLQGASLEALDLATLTGLLKEIDEDSGALLATYLDRRHPRWREHADAGATAGQGRAAPTGKMGEEEAYQILGVAPGASADEISRAHRLLMKKLHPDQGGSTYLAARVNEAKDVLLRRHR
jgi:DnaJ-domain-containing protein 1